MSDDGILKELEERIASSEEARKREPKERRSPKDDFEREYGRVYLRAITAEKKLKALEENFEVVEDLRGRNEELTGNLSVMRGQLRDKDRIIDSQSERISELGRGIQSRDSMISELNETINQQKLELEGKHAEGVERLKRLHSEAIGRLQRELEASKKRELEPIHEWHTEFVANPFYILAGAAAGLVAGLLLAPYALPLLLHLFGVLTSPPF